MSIDLDIVRKREIQVLKTGKIEIQTDHFSPWNSPAKITREIIASDNPLELYIEWVTAENVVEKTPVYSEGDIWGQGSVDYYEDINESLNHIKELNEWVSNSIKSGYDVLFRET